MDFTVGQHFEHPEYGPATVVYVGPDYIGLEFGNGQNALLRRDSLLQQRQAAPPTPATEIGQEFMERLPWPLSTFTYEDDTAEHFLGAHWSPFVDEPKEMFLRLPEMIKAATVKTGFGDIKKPPRHLPEEWRQGFVLAWPSPQMGMAFGLKTTPEANVIASAYPFVTDGSQHLLCLRRVNIWEDGITAQIVADCGEAELAFFDTDFVANRGWYESGSAQEFILAGIAYGAKPSEVFELPFTPNPEQVEWERIMAERRGEAPREVPETLSLRGMAMLMQMQDGDIDEFSFRGPVIQVSPFENFFGQDGWRVRVTVLRFDDEDVDLDIYITRRAWEGAEPPQQGEDIEGTLWLQGRLWSPQPRR